MKNSGVLFLFILLTAAWVTEQALIPVSTASARTFLISQSNESPAPARVPTLSLDFNEWKTHRDNNQTFSMKYPEHIVIHTMDHDTTQFIYSGSTQKKDTEWYDGINILIDTGELERQSIQSFAKTEADSEPSPITLAGKTGFTYQERSINARTVILLPRSSDSYLRIVDATADPELRGYQTIVDTMLESLRISP